MARDLKLQVLLNAVDKATGPLKKITQGSGKTAEALKASRDQLRSLEKAQKDLRGFRDMKKQASETSDALKEERARIKELSTQIRQAEGDTSSFNKERDKAIKKAQKLANEYDQQRREAHQLKATIRDTHGITGKLAGSEESLTKKIRKANSEIDQQKQKLKKLGDAQRKAQAASDQYHRSLGRANTMRSAGFTGMATGGAALYGGARLLNPGIEYGQAASKVQALTRLEKDDPRFQALKQQSRDLGSSTAFSASEVAQGQGFLAMAGFDPEAIQKAIPDMLNMALANDMDLARASDISSNILSGFGLDPDQMGRVGDVLTATTTRANVDLEMLGESMKYVAPQARAMGVSMEEAAAMTGLLGNVGIQGSQAGTTLRAMMTRLAAPTGAAAGALKELGVEASDADGNLRAVPKILADVAKATESMGNADRAAYLKSIFGEEPGAGMAELIGQQGAAGIEKFVEILKGSMGEAAKVAETRTDNIGGDLKGLQSAWEEVGISITDTNEEPLRDLVQWVTSITRAVGDWIKANPELASTIAKVAAGVAALVATGGALTVMLASLLGPIVTVRYGLAMLGIKTGGLGGRIYSLTSKILPALGSALMWLGRIFLTVGRMFLMNPIGLAVTAIAGAAYLIYRYWEPISDFFIGLFRQIDGAFEGGIAGVVKRLIDWSPIGLVHKAIVSGLSAMGLEVPAMFSSFGTYIVDGLVLGIRNGWSELGSAIREMGGNIGSWFKEVLGIHSPSRVFAGFGANIIEGLIGGLQEKWAALKGTVTGIAGSVTGWFKDKMGIHSPSRVFAALGGHTVDGLTLGLERQRDDPAKSVTDIASRVRAAGAGLALGAMALPAAAMPSISASEPIRFDNRPPLASQAAAPSYQDNSTSHYTITINAPPGGDEHAIANAVSRELDRRSREQQARRRSSMWDRD
ncbi:phage tail tape measure protein [Larsenimonas rhizosphaerae]|uniref:phage tail tape measure protein n=1 Tax=Larsenimonas rhizosphaerae TaxID=2944682 RepID=UPI0020339925|nr:phage tail tape measure protein [Larsenimonas rhizosphaerae]MCM2131455.1 phage tail tape measure protein [Larsenimonas rhizosphaerae]